MPNKWRTIKSLLVHKIRLHGRRGEGTTAEFFLREKLRQAPHLILDVRLMDVPAVVTQEERHTGFLIHLSSVVLNFIFFREKYSAVFLPRP